MFIALYCCISLLIITTPGGSSSRVLSRFQDHNKLPDRARSGRAADEERPSLSPAQINAEEFFQIVKLKSKVSGKNGA